MSGLSVVSFAAGCSCVLSSDRADLERRRLQLRHDDRRLERSHQPAGVLADHDLHREATRRQRHATTDRGSVARGQRLPVDPGGSFSVWRMRPTGRPCSSCTTPSTSSDQLVLVLLGGNRNRGSGDGERERHVVAVRRHPEVAGVHQHRQVGRRHRREQLLLELGLAIGARGVRGSRGRRSSRRAPRPWCSAASRGPGCGGTVRPCSGSRCCSRAGSRPTCRAARARTRRRSRWSR